MSRLSWCPLPLLTALAIVGVAAAACSSPAVAEDDAPTASRDAVTDIVKTVQMNDVSIMLPMARTKSAFAKVLTVDSVGRGGALLPQDVYEQAVGKPGTLQEGGTPGVPRADLRLVSLRFDPCFAQIGPITAGTVCQNQLRMIFQPTKFDGTTSTTEDSAVHAFYTLTRDELKSALASLIALRLVHDDGKRLGALAPHPILRAQGLDGAMAKGLNALLLRYAGAENLSRFTVFSTSGLGTAWNFEGFDIHAGTPTPMVIPAVKPGTTTVAFFRGFTKKTLSGDFTPPTTSHDDMQLLANGERASTASADAQKAAFDAALRIENPTVHSPDTIDCASCHAAQPARVMVGERSLALSSKDNGNAFVASSLAVPAVDLVQTTKPKDEDDVDVHMFSYKDVTPSIHQRTINETASIVAYLNEARIVTIP